MILDRYFMRTFLKQFFYSLVMFLGIYFFSAILAELPSLLKRAEMNPFVTTGNVFKSYLLKIPDFFLTVFPFAYLFSLSYVLGNFYKNNEIIAVISSGWNMRRITFPLIFVSLLASGFLLFLNDSIVPSYNYQNALMEEQLYREAKIRDVDNIQTYGEGGILYFSRYYNSRNRSFASLMILKAREGKFPQILEQNFIPMDFLSRLGTKEQISAIAGGDEGVENEDFPFEWMIRGDQMIYDEKSGKWRINQGIRWEWDTHGKLLQVTDLSQYELAVKEKPEYFSKETRNIKEMSVSETLVYIDKLKKSRQSYQKELVEFYSEKYSKPFGVFILALLSSALGRFFSRKHLLVMTLIFSFVIGIIYYVFLNIGISLGKEGILPPFPAAFFGNFISVGIYFYLRRYQLT